MRTPGSLRTLIKICILVTAGLAISSGARGMEKCMICHGKLDLERVEATGLRVSLHVDEAMVAASVHADKECTDCHIDVVNIPHTAPEKVNCRRCHYTGNPVGAPGGEIYDQYEHSVHGMEIVAGNSRAPVCQTCHGGHDIAAHGAEKSRLSSAHLPETCGQCHMDAFAHFQQSVHGVALAEGNTDAPSCTSCHGEHTIQRPTDPSSSVAPISISHTCGECHGPLGVAAKYGIRTDRTKTFEESFHGVANQMGNTTVANCASCHSHHDIRPTDDPLSSVNKANIVRTCGQVECHEEATTAFASGKIHVDPTSEESGLLYYITNFFAILTISVMAGLFIFILLDLYNRAARARKQKASKINE